MLERFTLTDIAVAEDSKMLLFFTFLRHSSTEEDKLNNFTIV